MGTPSPPLVNSSYASRLEYPQTAETMLASVVRTPPDGNRRLVLVNCTWISIVWVVRHDAVEFSVGDGRHVCHDDGRERGEVPLYVEKPLLN